MTQSIFWAKYGSPNPAGKNWVVEGERFDHGGDQPLHCDYADNSLVHPDPENFDVVSCIIYFDDSDETGGSTGIVPTDDFVRAIWQQEKMIPSHQTPSSMGGLYDREYGVKARRGTVLLYRHDTWHRGTAVKRDQLRRTLGVVYRRADAGWVQFDTWTKDYRHKLRKAVPALSATQRTALGFPAPGSRYWNAHTREAVATRYPGIDMTPYAAAPGSSRPRL